MKHTVLCVDDEPDIVDSLERLFRSKYRVLKATSGREALELLEKEDVSLIISDQRMPEITGVELLSRSLQIRPQAMRILLTGYTDVESVISAINSGQIYRYITKPWDPRDLQATVDRAIERFDLQKELKTKNVELQTALSELQTLDKAKDQFMILINHELKTPLTSLISYLDLLRETQLNSEQIVFIDRIAGSCQRLKELIFDVLELMSAQTGRTLVKHEELNVEKVIQQAVEPLKNLFQKNRHQLKVDLKVNQLLCDSRIFSNILKRLVHNATKFGTPDTEIRVSNQMTPAGIEFEITNQGAPLDPEITRRLLQPFTINTDIMNHSRGLGLGLSVSNELLKLLGSRIQFPASSDSVRVQFTLPSGPRPSNT